MENEIELLKTKLETRKELCDNLQQRIDKAIEWVNNHDVDDGWELLEILGDKEQDIELDVLKALNTDLDDDVEMG